MPHLEKGPAGVGYPAASVLLEKSQNNVKSMPTFYRREKGRSHGRMD